MEQNYDEKDINQIMKENEERAIEEIKRLKEEINNGNTTCENYYELFSNQRSLEDSENKYKSLIDAYAQSTIKAGVDEISNNRATSLTYTYLAHTYEYLKDYEKALYYYNKTVELYPNDDQAYVARGSFYSHRKKTKLADLDFKKAIELNPENEEFIELIKNSDKLIAHSDKLLNEIKIVNIIFWGIIIYFGYQILSIGFSIIGEIFKTFVG